MVVWWSISRYIVRLVTCRMHHDSGDVIAENIEPSRRLFQVQTCKRPWSRRKRVRSLGGRAARARQAPTRRALPAAALCRRNRCLYLFPYWLYFSLEITRRCISWPPGRGYVCFDLEAPCRRIPDGMATSPSSLLAGLIIWRRHSRNSGRAANRAGQRVR